mmetsp:Transcript_14291/g.31010  ORF Transcript_14291/g.31010 Transcript_14291/m.31010 type:complete len:273 (-) Transcript_14291:1810-2628(-)
MSLSFLLSILFIIMILLVLFLLVLLLLVFLLFDRGFFVHSDRFGSATFVGCREGSLFRRLFIVSRSVVNSSCRRLLCSIFTTAVFALLLLSTSTFLLWFWWFFSSSSICSSLLCCVFLIGVVIVNGIILVGICSGDGCFFQSITLLLLPTPFLLTITTTIRLRFHLLLLTLPLNLLLRHPFLLLRLQHLPKFLPLLGTWHIFLILPYIRHHFFQTDKLLQGSIICKKNLFVGKSVTVFLDCAIFEAGGKVADNIFVVEFVQFRLQFGFELFV